MLAVVQQLKMWSVFVDCQKLSVMETFALR